MRATLRVNNTTHELSVDARLTLLDALRDILGLTGTKKGCDQGVRTYEDSLPGTAVTLVVKVEHVLPLLEAFTIRRSSSLRLRLSGMRCGRRRQVRPRDSP
jgi:hypothetical protein